MTVVRYTSESLQERKNPQRKIFHHKLAVSSHSRETVDLPEVSASGVFPPRVRQGGRKQQSGAKARQRPAMFAWSDLNARWLHEQETWPGR